MLTHGLILAITLGGMERYQEAISAYRRTIKLNSKHLKAFQQLAYILYRLDRPQESVAVIRKWLKKDPGNPIATHMLAACSGKKVPARASDRYVQTHFNQFANGFEEQLERLQYRVPTLIASILAEWHPKAKPCLRILDAGCGTGLCATYLAPYATYLHGVDLSTSMLEKARALALYHKLTLAELGAFLATCTQSYDLVVAADSVIYFGNLEPLCKAVANALQKGGQWFFNVEDCGQDGTNFRLEPHGRYSHSETYLQACLLKFGFQVLSLQQKSPRLEGGHPVPGWMVVAEKN